MTSERKVTSRIRKAEREHEADHVGQAVRHLAGEVEVACGVAGDRGLNAGHAAERLRDQDRAQRLDGMLAGGVVAETRQRQLDRADLSVAAAAELKGGWATPRAAASVSRLSGRLLRPRDARSRGKGEDDERRHRGAGEVAVDLRLQSGGNLWVHRVRARIGGVQAERRDRQRDEQRHGAGGPEDGAAQDAVDQRPARSATRRCSRADAAGRGSRRGRCAGREARAVREGQ